MSKPQPDYENLTKGAAWTPLAEASPSISRASDDKEAQGILGIQVKKFSERMQIDNSLLKNRTNKKTLVTRSSVKSKHNYMQIIDAKKIKIPKKAA